MVIGYIQAPETTLEYKIGLYHGKLERKPTYGWDQTPTARQNYFLGWAEGYVERRRTKMSGRHAYPIEEAEQLPRRDRRLRKQSGRHAGEVMSNIDKYLGSVNIPPAPDVESPQTLSDFFQALGDQGGSRVDFQKLVEQFNPRPGLPGTVVVVDPETGNAVGTYEVGQEDECDGQG